MRERDFIQSIAKRIQAPNLLLEKGIGDDCAIFRAVPANDWLVSADMLVEGVHFDSSWHVPYLLGILVNRSITTEFSCTNGISYRLFSPTFSIFIF